MSKDVKGCQRMSKDVKDTVFSAWQFQKQIRCTHKRDVLRTIQVVTMRPHGSQITLGEELDATAPNLHAQPLSQSPECVLDGHH